MKEEKNIEKLAACVYCFAILRLHSVNSNVHHFSFFFFFEYDSVIVHSLLKGKKSPFLISGILYYDDLSYFIIVFWMHLVWDPEENMTYCFVCLLSVSWMQVVMNFFLFYVILFRFFFMFIFCIFHHFWVFFCIVKENVLYSVVWKFRRL